MERVDRNSLADSSAEGEEQEGQGDQGKAQQEQLPGEETLQEENDDLDRSGEGEHRRNGKEKGFTT